MVDEDPAVDECQGSVDAWDWVFQARTGWRLAFQVLGWKIVSPPVEAIARAAGQGGSLQWARTVVIGAWTGIRTRNANPTYLGH